jgi:hypothetical protein
MLYLPTTASAYASANVRLVVISMPELKLVLKRDKKTIDACVARAV